MSPFLLLILRLLCGQSLPVGSRVASSPKRAVTAAINNGGGDEQYFLFSCRGVKFGCALVGFFIGHYFHGKLFLLLPPTLIGGQLSPLLSAPIEHLTFLFTLPGMPDCYNFASHKNSCCCSSCLSIFLTVPVRQIKKSRTPKCADFKIIQILGVWIRSNQPVLKCLDTQTFGHFKHLKHIPYSRWNRNLTWRARQCSLNKGRFSGPFPWSYRLMLKKNILGTCLNKQFV